ncbi:MAG TPA: rod-binding protein [Gemmatimonadaceae bacterium]|jgi:flagellar protein FlgJ|nr:rod-binding protein [Gemmatimonadaceae bacterium]
MSVLAAASASAQAIAAAISPGKPPVSDDTRLKKTAQQLEGLFVQKLFAAMRDTVPEDGIVPQSDAENTFTTMLDEKMSEKVPSQWSGEHSLAQALYHQLHQRLARSAATSPAAPSTDVTR